MQVLLLSGGASEEHEVSLRSGQAVAKALDSLGHTYVVADPSDKDFELSKLIENVDVVFPALHGAGGEDGSLQKKFEEYGINFVGSGSNSSELCFNKWKYKELLRKNDFPVSKGWMVSADDIERDKFKTPFVLKPVDGGSSLDTLIARTVDEAKLNQAEVLLQKYEQMLLEPLVEGVEITVGILGDKALPVIEIIPAEGREFDYDNKYNGTTQELCPPVHLEKEVQMAAQELALKIHSLCRCSHFSRTDIIVSPDGGMFVLETNTIPGLTEQSLFPKMAEANGMSFSDLIDNLLKLATN